MAVIGRNRIDRSTLRRFHHRRLAGVDPGPAEGLDGAAEAAGGRPAGLNHIDLGANRVVVEIAAVERIAW